MSVHYNLLLQLWNQGNSQAFLAKWLECKDRKLLSREEEQWIRSCLLPLAKENLGIQISD